MRKTFSFSVRPSLRIERVLWRKTVQGRGGVCVCVCAGVMARLLNRQSSTLVSLLNTLKKAMKHKAEGETVTGG